MAKRKLLTEKQRSQLRVFAQDLEDGGGSLYCGNLESYRQLKDGIGNVITGLIDDIYNGSRTSIDINLQVVKMTDRQVANLPEL